MLGHRCLERRNDKGLGVVISACTLIGLKLQLQARYLQGLLLHFPPKMVVLLVQTRILPSNGVIRIQKLPPTAGVCVGCGLQRSMGCARIRPPEPVDGQAVHSGAKAKRKQGT